VETKIKIFGNFSYICKMETYNNWTVLEYCEKDKYNGQYVLARCLCGTIKKVGLRFIVSGKSKSCGCYRRGVGKPVVTNQMIVEKYNETKSLKDTARFFKKGDMIISKILKEEGVQLYASLRKDKEEIRKRLVNKVINYRRRRLKRDPLYKSRLRMRSLIGQVFIRMNYTKKSKCTDILGINWDGFKIHIESNFKEGMTWDNYGMWEYDHIIPISIAQNEEELIKLNHYTNFQPLWKEENKLKSNKIL
jgi:hypothetical protein